MLVSLTCTALLLSCSHKLATSRKQAAGLAHLLLKAEEVSSLRLQLPGRTQVTAWPG